jgi:hypothetical protein
LSDKLWENIFFGKLRYFSGISGLGLADGAIRLPQVQGADMPSLGAADAFVDWVSADWTSLHS